MFYTKGHRDQTFLAKEGQLEYNSTILQDQIDPLTIHKMKKYSLTGHKRTVVGKKVKTLRSKDNCRQQFTEKQ